MNRLGAILFALLPPLAASAGTRASGPTQRVGNSTVFWKAGKAFLFTPTKQLPRAGTEAAARDAFVEQLDLFDTHAVPGRLSGGNSTATGTIRALRDVKFTATQSELKSFLETWQGIWNAPKRDRPSALPPSLWQPMHALMAKARGDLAAETVKPSTLFLGPTQHAVPALPPPAADDAPFVVGPHLTEAKRGQLLRRIHQALYERTTQGSRLHRLTPELAARLPQGVQKSVKGIVQLAGGATGFLVWREPGSERALLMTNRHVASGNVTLGEEFKFLDGSKGEMVRLVASSIEHDYKLAEVKLPVTSTAEPVTLDARGPNTGSARGLRAGAKVYALGGGTGLRPVANPVDAVAGGPEIQNAIASAVLGYAPPVRPNGIRRARLLTMPSSNFTIAQGKIAADAKLQTKSLGDDGRLEVMVASLPNMPGMSGSPIHEVGSNMVIGLHTMGNASPATGKPGVDGHRPDAAWIESAVPMDLIIRDLWKLDRGTQTSQIPEASRDLLRRMLVHVDQQDIARGPR